MVRLLFVYAFLAVVLLAEGCSCGHSGRNLSADFSVDTIDLNHATRVERILYSEMLEKPKVIVLETKPGSIIQKIRAVEIFEDRIYICDDRSNRLFVFDMDGRFLRRIGDRGNGRGEYIELSDFSINRERHHIYLWDDAASKVNVYDTRNYQFVGVHKIREEGYRNLHFLYHEGRYYLSRFSKNDRMDNYAIMEFDTVSYEQTASLFNSYTYSNGWNYPLQMEGDVFYSKNTSSPKYIGMFSNYIMEISPSGAKPKYVIESDAFISRDEVKTFLQKALKDDYLNHSYLYERDRIWNILQYAEIKNLISFQYHKGMDKEYVVYNRDNGEVRITPALLNDYVSSVNIPPYFAYSDSVGVLSILPTAFTGYFKQYIIDAGMLNKDVDNYEKLMKVREESNPILFYHPYKRDETDGKEEE